MRTRLLKEFRQLLPGWCVAMLLPVSPLLWAMSGFREEPWGLGIALSIGTMAVLATSVFGHEFNHRTFGLLTAQPVSRNRIFWEKVLVLFLALSAATVVFVVAWSCSSSSISEAWFPMRTFAPVVTLAMLTGGLWSALVFRQIGASLCFTFVIPTGLSAVASTLASRWLSGSEVEVVGAALVAYSLGGLWLARRLFLEAQDHQWLGSEIAFSFRSQGAAARLEGAPFDHARSPVGALIKKELLLQQSVFLCAAVYAVMVAGVAGLIKLTSPEWGAGLGDMLGGLLILGWIVLALLAGAMAVAEERRLGTLDSQYCLPVPCRIQFFVKFAVTLAVSALLAVALPWLLTRASSLLVDERLAELPGGELFCASLGAAALAFYASSLTRTVLQAVLTAFGLAVSGGAIAAWLDESGRGVLGGLGPLPGHGFVFLIVVPIAALVLLRLSFTNFRSPDGGWRLWWPNLRAWLLLALALYLSPLAVFLVRIGWALSTARGH